MSCAIDHFSMAHQWRKPACAIDIGALRKNQWRIGRAIRFVPMARQWRNGARTIPRNAFAQGRPAHRLKCSQRTHTESRCRAD